MTIQTLCLLYSIKVITPQLISEEHSKDSISDLFFKYVKEIQKINFELNQMIKSL